MNRPVFRGTQAARRRTLKESRQDCGSLRVDVWRKTEGKGRVGKGRVGKGRVGKGRAGKGRAGRRGRRTPCRTWLLIHTVQYAAYYQGTRSVRGGTALAFPFFRCVPFRPGNGVYLCPTASVLLPAKDLRSHGP